MCYIMTLKLFDILDNYVGYFIYGHDKYYFQNDIINFLNLNSNLDFDYEDFELSNINIEKIKKRNNDELICYNLPLTQLLNIELLKNDHDQECVKQLMVVTQKDIGHVIYNKTCNLDNDEKPYLFRYSK